MNGSREVSTGIDWLTVTAINPDQSQKLQQTVNQIKKQVLPADAMSKPWGAMGYKGFTYGDMKYGARHDDNAILILSGDIADKVDVSIQVEWPRITRLDLQVTVALANHDPDLAFKLYEKAKKLEKLGETSMIGTYISSGTGDTYTLGKRKSTRYLRLYDKGGQSGSNERGHVWRYEVEYKKDLAKRVYERVNSNSERYQFIKRAVHSEFLRKGVEPAFQNDDQIVAMEAGIRITTPDQKLAWLQRCVSPVVTQLVALGYEEEVLKNLKLRGIVRSSYNNGSQRSLSSQCELHSP